MSSANRPTLVVLNVIYKTEIKQRRVSIGNCEHFVSDTTNLYLIGKHKDGGKENLYAFPGGKVEFETIEKAFFRELEEETGLVKDKKNPYYQLQYLGFHEVELKNKKFFNMIFAYPYTKGMGEPKTIEPHKHYGWEWLTLEEIKKLPLASSTKDFIDNMEWQLHE